MSASAAAAFLREHDNYVVTAHVNPDGDALGAILGMGSILKALGKHYRLLSHNLPVEMYEFLPDIGMVEQVNPDAAYEFDAAVILDIGEWDRMGDVAGVIDEEALAVLNIDHHQSNLRFGDIAYVDPHACSASIMVYAVARELGITISPALATQLYTGILTDTGGFHFSNTDGNVLRTCGDLIDLGADPTFIMTKVYHEKTVLSVKVTESVLSTLEFHAEHRIASVVLDQNVASRIGDYTMQEIVASTEGIIDYIRSIRGVWMAIFFREEQDGVKISLRSNRDGLDMNRLAGQYGGGGHIQASGAHVTQPLSVVKAEFLAAAKAMVRKIDAVGV